jgi:Ca-activated chloride channel family protein
MTTDNASTDGGQPVPGEAADARLTAHALEQLEGDERAAVERLLADPARHGDRAAVEETRQLAAALRAGRLADAPPRSADLRRAVIAAITAQGAAGVAPATTVAPPRRSFGWPLAIAGSLLAAVLVMVTVVSDRPAMLEQKSDREVASRLAKEGPPIDGRLMNRQQTEGRPTPSASPAANELGLADAAAEVTKAAAPAARELADGKPRQELEEARRALPEPAPGASAPRPEAAQQAAGGRATPPPAARARSLNDYAKSDDLHPKDRDGRAAIERPLIVGQTLAEKQVGQADRSGGERYARIAEGRMAPTDQQPLSTFSIDVDTASYANVRRFLASGRLPPPDAVRIEELVNYFRYDYPQPAGDVPFSVTVEAAACPWNPGRRLVRIGLQGRVVDRRERPAGNLVFLVDVSGSMGAPNKLPLVKQALAMLVEELTENDSVAIVTYAGDAGLKLPATSGDQKATILAAIESLSSGGSTHGSAGITLAYAQAAERFITGGVNRVILATDGDLNVGVTSDEALVALIKEKAAGGTFLTVLGFGEGNLQDEKMEKIADNGNGVYAYIDGAREARKVLVEQLTGSTITIAKDVKIQVEFNPAQVASHRLLGYENRVMAAADFRNDRKDAGEIGAGHSVTALYEIELTGEAGGGPATGAEPLKYQPQPAAAPRAEAAASRELLTVKLRWKRPDGDTSRLEEVPLADRGGAFEEASDDLRFAAAVAAFGMILRNSEHRGEATLPMVARIAGGSLGTDAGGWRAEFLDLVRKAESLRGDGR